MSFEEFAGAASVGKGRTARCEQLTGRTLKTMLFGELDAAKIRELISQLERAGSSTVAAKEAIETLNIHVRKGQ